ncbi:hypothetical protein PanWU01x14_022610 [Parasponia andersonii]|uniref:Uncharacterized protein n=1 Tax=Parasponia andersonii TaxID=3476 RepID=A0A2P5DX87_PARAD|nr:hypothetical protein PanWU01x14_022610 [Parasponia andersonii]
MKGKAEECQCHIGPVLVQISDYGSDDAFDIRSQLALEIIPKWVKRRPLVFLESESTLNPPLALKLGDEDPSQW